jgi:pyruvate dehydrogenase (quinone)
MMADCDTLLMVGSGFPYTEFLPKPGQARGVQIDLDPSMLSLRYPMEVGLVGDAAETLRALQPLLTRKTERTWRTLTEQRVRDWRDELERRAQEPAKPLNPQLVTRELSRRLPDDVIVAGDSGSSTVWLARHLELRRGMLCSLSGTLATMGSALPYGLAAKFAHPSRPVVALSGDGAMQMIGNAGLIAVSRYWRRWRDPRLILVVFNNRDLNYVTWEQRAMEGEPKFPASQDLPDFDYARYAELIGLKGIRIERPDQVGSALDEALRESRPVVIDAVVDPDVPTLPPTMKEKQEKMLDTALRKGDPDRVDVERQVAREDARK